MAPVPESVLKKRKRDEQWAAQKAAERETKLSELKKKKKVIFKRAEQYVKEYVDHEKDLIRLKREARANGGYHVPSEARLMFVVRIRGVCDMHPKTRKILQLLRLRQINNGIFLKVNKATLNMLKKVEPYVTFGYPTQKTVRDLIYKRGFGKMGGGRTFMASVDHSFAPFFSISSLSSSSSCCTLQEARHTKEHLPQPPRMVGLD